MENDHLKVMLSEFASLAGQRRASIFKMSACECCGKSNGRDAVSEAGHVADAIFGAARLFLEESASRNISGLAEMAFMAELDRRATDT